MVVVRLIDVLTGDNLKIFSDNNQIQLLSFHLLLKLSKLKNTNKTDNVYLMPKT